MKTGGCGIILVGKDIVSKAEEKSQMAFDFKKEYKEFYMPKNKPSIVVNLLLKKKHMELVLIRLTMLFKNLMKLKTY